MATTVAVLGVGCMGGQVARRLAESVDVVAYDPDAGRLAALPTAIRRASTIADAVAGSDAVVAVLPGAAEQRSVLPGVVGRLSPGALLIDLTSGDPVTARALQAAARTRGASYVAAPMGGGPSDAAAGSLRLHLGGDDSAVDRAAALLAPLVSDGGELLRVSEDAGAAMTAKLLVNALWFAQATAVAEALHVGEAAGLPASVLRRVLDGSAADSAFVQDHLDRFLAGDDMTGFGLDRVVEELDTVAALTGDEGTVLAASRRAHASALRAGFDGELGGARWALGGATGAPNS